MSHVLDSKNQIVNHLVLQHITFDTGAERLSNMGIFIVTRQESAFGLWERPMQFAGSVNPV